MWFLSLATDCRIFQAKTVPEIVKAVLSESGVTDVRDALTGTYAAREYCVQYRESHLDFISRLMEEEGIFYFFEHTKDKHTLVLADASSAVKSGATAKLRMQAMTSGPGSITEDSIIELSVDTEVRSHRQGHADGLQRQHGQTVGGQRDGQERRRARRS